MTPIARLLAGQAERYTDEVMLRVDGEGRTYDRLLADVRGLAVGLGALGVGPGTRVAMLMDVSHEAIDAWLACDLLGCVQAPLNTNYRGRLLTHLLRDSRAEYVLCDAAHLPELARVLADLEPRPRIVVHGERPPAGGDSSPTDVAASLAELYHDPASWQDPDTDAGEVILYTSGTTGPSKGVVHNQRGCILLARYVAEVCDYGPGDRLLNFFPLYHQNARYTGVLTAIAAGAAIDLERSFTSSRFWDLCRDRGSTAFNYLGSLLGMLLTGSGPEDPVRDRDHPVRLGWGAGATRDQRRAFQRRFGVELIEVYGLSEAPMATVNLPGSGSDDGSAGRESRFFEVRVVDDHGEAVGPDTPGEILLRPKINDVFTRGYYGNDAATVAATADLWFRTGDRGFLSETGDLSFVERAKDSLRRRGENISTWEVESVLVADPRVREAAVYGVPTGDGEEEVVAALLLADPDDDVRDIVRTAAADLPRYAVPRFVRAVDDLPRTPTMKVQKSELRSAGITADTYDLLAEE